MHNPSFYGLHYQRNFTEFTFGKNQELVNYKSISDLSKMDSHKQGKFTNFMFSPYDFSKD